MGWSTIKFRASVGCVMLTRTRGVTLAWSFGAEAATARCLGVVAGGAPLAAVVYVAAGAGALRLSCEPAWVAAGPLIVYALFTPLALGAALICATRSKQLR